jgi:hypothetical protein
LQTLAVIHLPGTDEPGVLQVNMIVIILRVVINRSQAASRKRDDMMIVS